MDQSERAESDDRCREELVILAELSSQVVREVLCDGRSRASLDQVVFAALGDDVQRSDVVRHGSVGVGRAVGARLRRADDGLAIARAAGRKS